MVRDFLGRDEEFAAFSKWLNEEFEEQLAAGSRSLQLLGSATGYWLGAWLVRHSAMNASDFKRIALSLEGAEEGSHMGAVDFRVGGRIFATLATVKEGYGNLMLTPEVQAEFHRRAARFVFAGAWRMGPQWRHAYPPRSCR